LTDAADLASLEGVMVVRSAQQHLVAQLSAANTASYWRWFGGFSLFASGRHDLRSHH
jgi:hypothetical protein